MWAIIERFPITFYHIGLRYFLAAFLAFLVFYILLKNRNPIRKIQDKFPALSDYKRDIWYSTITIAIFAIISLFSFITMKPYNLLYDSLSDKSIVYWVFTVVPIFFIHDLYFYIAHRLMHHPALFIRVHKVHHLSTNPSPWTAYAFHPFEAVIEASITLLLVFTVPTHAVVIIFFMIFQIVYNVYGHLGYELYPKGFNKTWVGKWVNTSVSHNQHHKHFHGNYGLYTLIWDRLFGTLRADYDTAFEQATNKKQPANAITRQPVG